MAIQMTYKFSEYMNQLLSDILKRNWSDISNVDDGIKKIKERLCGKKVLVLPDDFDERIHLNALMGRPVWFGKGSRMIITSRNMGVFNVPEVCCIYELTGMGFKHSLQLFCRHDFRGDHPSDEYAALPNEAVKITGGLPLALEVIGSLLWGKSKDVWGVTLEKLETVPHEEAQRKLKICHDALHYRQKQIFLNWPVLTLDLIKRMCFTCGLPISSQVKVFKPSRRGL
ncbi:disease resistance protein Roq1-like [Rhodamnia argentea]|uniref:Disease resistance protein Roq1-like n=1 Tax=Rhodamnia argentea TaxID=178133 RepID=A0A8B8MUT7_9MYRT|nr:disease resistance protein Roq1-like [Rhodamnia argentea]